MFIAPVGLEVSGDCHGVGCDHTAKLQLSYEQDKSERAPGYAGDSSRGARTVAEEEESGFKWWLVGLRAQSSAPTRPDSFCHSDDMIGGERRDT